MASKKHYEDNPFLEVVEPERRMERAYNKTSLLV